MKKLQAIIKSLRDNADQIAKLAIIIEGQYASRARLEAVQERGENQKERDEGSAWRKQMQSDRVRSWLGGDMVNESNLRRHANNLNICKPGSTCDWLSDDYYFRKWVDEPSANPMIWLCAGPGAGKSVLSSYAADYVERQKGSAAVAIHFYEFDNQRTAVSTAQVIAIQLFEKYWLLYRDIPDDLLDASQKSKANLSNILEFTKLLVRKIPSVYLFLDGLDEECNLSRWAEAAKILEYVIGLAENEPIRVRLWCSSQDSFIIRNKLQNFPTLEVKDKMQIAVEEYISSTVLGINNPDVDRATRGWILSSLKSRAKGSFLWASLMVKTIDDGVTSFDDMERFIEEGLPQDVDEYYRRIFARYEAKERALARSVLLAPILASITTLIDAAKFLQL